MKNIKISSKYITLGQFLKFSGIISNGGEAKDYLQNHEVFVDGEMDSRRGRKLYPEMTVIIDKKEFKIVEK